MLLQIGACILTLVIAFIIGRQYAPNASSLITQFLNTIIVISAVVRSAAGKPKVLVKIAPNNRYAEVKVALGDREQNFYLQPIKIDDAEVQLHVKSRDPVVKGLTQLELPHHNDYYFFPPLTPNDLDVEEAMIIVLTLDGEMKLKRHYTGDEAIDLQALLKEPVSKPKLMEAYDD